ncbi:F0F1 ATP synthase subunit alpha, partial [Candidatus Poribacteria bacterium]|nr:F0F1 ATP synthase subunit alpha [Candidatus Poribacteria bacterium]
LIELLKQPQYQPLPVEKEIVSIFSGSNGYLDDIELTDVARFETELLSFMDQNHSDILEEIVTTGNLSDDLAEKLSEATSAFKASFQPSISEA